MEANDVFGRLSEKFREAAREREMLADVFRQLKDSEVSVEKSADALDITVRGKLADGSSVAVNVSEGYDTFVLSLYRDGEFEFSITVHSGVYFALCELTGGE